MNFNPIVLILIGIIIVAVISLFRIYRWRAQKEDEFVYDEPEPFIERRATVLRKDVYMVHKGKYGCGAIYEVEFSFTDGETKTMEIPEPLYDRFAEGMTAKLITQNDRFIGFGKIDIGELNDEAIETFDSDD